MEIDIAIDLGGHTGQARPQIFAHRPAPVQATWLGYPGTTGRPSSITDCRSVVAPFAHQPFTSEHLVHLPNTYFPADPARASAPRPAAPNAACRRRRFVFCAFNSAFKITKPVLDVWIRLLDAVPGSVLWLETACRDTRANLEREAAPRGIDPARLVYADDAPLEVHLARHALADLFLDTLPYNAHAIVGDPRKVPVCRC